MYVQQWLRSAVLLHVCFRHYGDVFPRYVEVGQAESQDLRLTEIRLDRNRDSSRGMRRSYPHI
jgi:hypothetical protein